MRDGLERLGRSLVGRAGVCRSRRGSGRGRRTIVSRSQTHRLPVPRRFCFATPESPGGLYINLSTFQAFDEEHVDLDQERTGAVLYLHEKAHRVGRVGRVAMQEGRQARECERLGSWDGQWALPLEAPGDVRAAQGPAPGLRPTALCLTVGHHCGQPYALPLQVPLSEEEHKKLQDVPDKMAIGVEGGFQVRQLGGGAAGLG